MGKKLDQIREGVPDSFMAAIMTAVAFMLFLTVDQMHWWRLKPDYAFGWLVPVFVAYVVADRWPRLKEIFAATGKSPLPRWLKILSSAGAGLALGFGIACFLVGALYRAAVGATQPGSIALALGFGLVLVGTVYFNTPEGRIGVTCAQTHV